MPPLTGLIHSLNAETARTIITSLVAVDSIWSVVLRAIIWFGIAFVIIISTDQPEPEKSIRKLKSNLGFFLLFTFLAVGLLYLLFGFTAMPTAEISA